MTPPRPGTAVRMYVDGASRGNPGKAGAGVVFVDPTTGAVVGRSGKYLGTATNNVAEYEGLLLGLEIARARGLRLVEVLADSQLLVRQLNGAYRVTRPHLQALHARAAALLAALGSPPVAHTLRAGNTLADEMSNRAIDERMRGVDDVEWAPAGPRAPAPRAEAAPPRAAAPSLEEAVAGIRDPAGLAAFVRRLRDDLARRPAGREHDPLARFLDALAAVLDDVDGRGAGPTGRAPTDPSWRLVGDLLLAAKAHR